MFHRDNVARYFSDNASAWLADAYEGSGYNYPTPLHRLRVVRRIFSELPEVKSVLDVGCGGGQLAVALAEDGMHVTGIDESPEMLADARSRLNHLPLTLAQKIEFREGRLEGLPSGTYDALTALGFVGYLPSDDLLFQIGRRVVRDHGYLIVSFRNRLFNLMSISERTRLEVERGAFSTLADEFSKLAQKIERESAIEVLKLLHAVTGQLLEQNALTREQSQSPSSLRGMKYTGSFEARQSTPDEARAVASRNGFTNISFHGIHPHLAVPGLNTCLPPQVYNQLSDCLIPLEDQPISLAWSSVFIGVFQKSG